MTEHDLCGGSLPALCGGGGISRKNRLESYSCDRKNDLLHPIVNPLFYVCVCVCECVCVSECALGLTSVNKPIVMCYYHDTKPGLIQ